MPSLRGAVIYDGSMGLLLKITYHQIKSFWRCLFDVNLLTRQVDGCMLILISKCKGLQTNASGVLKLLSSRLKTLYLVLVKWELGLFKLLLLLCHLALDPGCQVLLNSLVNGLIPYVPFKLVVKYLLRSQIVLQRFLNALYHCVIVRLLVEFEGENVLQRLYQLLYTMLGYNALTRYHSEESLGKFDLEPLS